MWDTIQKLRFRAEANITGAQADLDLRLHDRLELPLAGIHGQRLFLTGISQLRKRAAELDAVYEKLPPSRGVRDTILLDAWSSATIEGARTTVAQVRRSLTDPKTKDDKMVVNTIAASKYAYDHPITGRNIRRLWEKVVDGVCETYEHMGTLYRSGMVYIGNESRIIHTPAPDGKLPEMMDRWFAFCQADTPELLIRSFAAHFYFVYVHPFCDGNGRTARILNASQLYHGGYRNMKRLPLSSAINNQLSGYYSSLADSESILRDEAGTWLDVSVFVSFMLDAFERCLIDAALSKNTLSEAETKLLERMNRVGINAEITAKKAAVILDRSESSARTLLNGLVQKGYLTADTSQTPYRYRLHKHLPE